MSHLSLDAPQGEHGLDADRGGGIVHSFLQSRQRRLGGTAAVAQGAGGQGSDGRLRVAQGLRSQSGRRRRRLGAHAAQGVGRHAALLRRFRCQRLVQHRDRVGSQIGQRGANHWLQDDEVLVGSQVERPNAPAPDLVGERAEIAQGIDRFQLYAGIGVAQGVHERPAAPGRAPAPEQGDHPRGRWHGPPPAYP